MRTVTIVNALLLAGMFTLSFTSQAIGTAPMNFHGTLLVPPPCTINDGDRIEVNFGKHMGINKVDGVNYRQPVNYQITCGKGESGDAALTLSLKGTATGFDQQALLTDKSDLGIRVYQNDKPFTPGSTLTIDQANPPRLEAVPVKNSGATLTEGKFEAWATLYAEYR